MRQVWRNKLDDANGRQKIRFLSHLEGCFISFILKKPQQLIWNFLGSLYINYKF